MLVLTRSAGEAVLLTLPSGEIVSFKVLSVRQGKVRVGIDAPSDVGIHRDVVPETKTQTSIQETV